jgi:hypothetical protein
MQGAKPITTHMATGQPLSKFTRNIFDNPQLYCSVVGALQYATITRLKILFAVNKVSQSMHNPTSSHWTSVKRILRCLKGTLGHGLYIQPSTSLELHAYVDSDWAGCLDDLKSTSGYLIFLGDNLIFCSSKKQMTVARSTIEVEYRRLAMITAEVI